MRLISSAASTDRPHSLKNTPICATAAAGETAGSPVYHPGRDFICAPRSDSSRQVSPTRLSSNPAVWNEMELCSDISTPTFRTWQLPC